MRPEILKLEAFGPYADEQVIDFAQLGDRKLFLICGPTGAGKSSVLDALCFALYGVASGDERSELELRSHFAPPDRETRVELTFTKGDVRYRVERSPRQLRPKKRGPAGFTEVGPTGALFRQTANGSWRPLASKPSQVTEQVRAVLGFQVSQFRQVVVLPQGQFRKLLSADSPEREQILATLFQTHLYRRFQEALKEARKKVEDDMRDLKRADEVALEEGGFEDLAALELARTEAGDALTKIQDSLAALDVEERAGLAKRDSARELSKRFGELDEARQVLGEFEARREEADSRESQLKMARKAATLAGAWEELALRREEAGEAEQALASAVRALKHAEREEVRTAKAFVRAEERAGKREEAQRKVHKLEELVGPRDDWAHAQEKLDHLAVDTEEQAAGLAEAEQEFKRIKGEIDELDREQTRLAEQAGKVDGLVLRADVAAQLCDAARRRDRASEDAEACEKERVRAGRRRSRLEADLAGHRGRLDDLLQRQLEGQATVMASSLEPGEACPVCGSTDHPSPAKSRRKVPDQASVDAQRDEVAQAEGDLSRARGLEAELDKRLAELTTKVDQAEKVLGESRAATLEQLDKDRAEAQKALATGQQAAKKLPSIKEARQTLGGQLQKLERRLDKAKQAAADAKQALDQAKGEVREKGKRVHHQYRSAGALEAAIEKARAEYQALEAAFEQARTEKDVAKEELARSRKQVDQERKELETKHKTIERRGKDFKRELVRAGFRSEQTFEDALLEPTELDALEQRVEDFVTARGESVRRLERAQAAVEGQTRPDLGAIEQDYQQARKASADARDQRTELAGQIKTLDTKLEAIKGRAAELEQLDERFSVVGGLSEAANDRAMTFERWVLSALLDEVLAAASVRLKRMSRDRFLLRRDLDQRDRRRAGGLDLRVFDAHTGAERSAASLSGGEGFMAALSLALGLADVVQAHSGGIRLDTLFVDEGFGALDPEALDQAFQTLLDLRFEGRLVGVISHVPELAARIDARLEVRPDGRGSRARWVL